MAKRPQCDWGGIELPNEDSEHQTPCSLQIDVHYTRLFIQNAWNWDRYIRLCSFLRLTPAELASIVRMPHEDLRGFEETLRLNPKRRGPLELLLTVFEATVYGELSGDTVKNPFPDLSKITDALSGHPQG